MRARGMLKEGRTSDVMCRPLRRPFEKDQHRLLPVRRLLQFEVRRGRHTLDAGLVPDRRPAVRVDLDDLNFRAGREAKMPRLGGRKVVQDRRCPRARRRLQSNALLDGSFDPVGAYI